MANLRVLQSGPPPRTPAAAAIRISCGETGRTRPLRSPTAAYLETRFDATGVRS